MKRLIVLTACLLISSVVLADNVNPSVSFNVTGGEQEAWDPYVCNVGMRHVDGGINICRHIETRETCTVADGNIPSCCADDPTKCECTTSKGRFMLDFIRFSDLNSDNNVHILNASFDPDSPLNMIFTGIYDDAIPMFDATPYPVISELRYNLSSEIYGAEYFLDVCYPAPGECKAVTYDKTYIQSTDFIGGNLSYAGLAHPTIKIEQVGGSSDCLSGVINQPMLSSSIINIIEESNPIKIEGEIAGCVIRFYFDETNTLAMRKWQRHDQTYKIKIRSEIEDTCDGNGCSRTPGYWKTHSMFSCNQPNCHKYDSTWDKIPEEVEGYSFFDPSLNEDHPFFNFIIGGVQATWISMMWNYNNCGIGTPILDDQSAFGCLAYQWIASTLNMLAGAPKSQLMPTWTAARDVLSQYPVMTKTRAEMIALKDFMDSYNNGLFDWVSHCEDEGEVETD
jgi:hypothetical protein